MFFFLFFLCFIISIIFFFFFFNDTATTEIYTLSLHDALLICLVAIIVFEREHLMVALVASIAVFAFVEAGFKGRLTRLVSSVNVGLAVVAALILAYEYFWQMVILGVLTLGLYVL